MVIMQSHMYMLYKVHRYYSSCHGNTALSNPSLTEEESHKLPCAVTECKMYVLN